MNITLPETLSLNFYSIFFFAYFCLGIVITLYVHYKIPKLDRGMFFAFGVSLLLFTLYRPIPLSRDDGAYIDLAKSICAFNDCGFILQSSRDWLWYFGISILKSITSNEHALMALTTISVAIKLFVIDRLCKQKLLALMLLIPLVYIQYDFTQLRAGLAISWYLIGLLFLIQHRLLLSGSFMGSNFILHAQALPSIALFPITWLNQKKWFLPILVILFTSLIYAGFFPNFSLIEKLHIFNTGANSYLAQTANGGYANVKVFPLGYLPILAYGLWLCWGISPQKDWLIKSVGASIALAILLAWFLSFNPTIQTRMFEFYIAPLVLLAGNIGSNKAKLVGTLVLAGILYLRLEWLHDWILG